MEENALTVSRLKPILYDLLMSASRNGNGGSDIALTQNLGVSLSNAVKKDGVNIVQIQNANLETVVPRIVEALQMVDRLEMKYSPLLDADRQLENLNHRLTNIELKRIPEVIDVTCREDEDTDPIEELCDFAYEQNFDWATVSDLMKVRYVEFLKGKFGSVKEVMDFLGISVSTYYQAKKRMVGNEKGSGNGNGGSANGGDSGKQGTETRMGL